MFAVAVPGYRSRMDMRAILERIAIRAMEIGIKEAEVSRRAGHVDLVRNWRRAIEAGEAINPRYDSLRRVAEALDVPERWLIDGTGYAEPLAQPARFGGSEVQRFRPASARDTIGAELMAAIAPQARHPAAFELRGPQPYLALLTGDIVIVDLQSRAEQSDTVIVNFDADRTGDAVMLIRRYFPPYLLSADLDGGAGVITLDDSGRAAIIGTVEAVVRPQARRAD